MKINDRQSTPITKQEFRLKYQHTALDINPEHFPNACSVHKIIRNNLLHILPLMMIL